MSTLWVVSTIVKLLEYPTYTRCIYLELGPIYSLQNQQGLNLHYQYMQLFLRCGTLQSAILVVEQKPQYLYSSLTILLKLYIRHKKNYANKFESFKNTFEQFTEHQYFTELIRLYFLFISLTDIRCVHVSKCSTILKVVENKSKCDLTECFTPTAVNPVTIIEAQ